MKGDPFFPSHFSPFLANGPIVQQKQSVLGSENMKCLAKFKLNNLPFFFFWYLIFSISFSFIVRIGWLCCGGVGGRWSGYGNTSGSLGERLFTHSWLPALTYSCWLLFWVVLVIVLVTMLMFWERLFTHSWLPALTHSCLLLFWDHFLTLLMMMLIALLMPIIILENCGKG